MGTVPQVAAPPPPIPAPKYTEPALIAQQNYENPTEKYKAPEYYKPPYLPPLDPEFIRSIMPPYQPAPPPYPPNRPIDPFYSKPQYPYQQPQTVPRSYTQPEYNQFAQPAYSGYAQPSDIPQAYYNQPAPKTSMYMPEVSRMAPPISTEYTPYSQPIYTSQQNIPKQAPPLPSYSLPEIEETTRIMGPPPLPKAEKSIEEKYEQVWSGFITRSKQHRVGVDAYLVSGKVNELLIDYNLNVSHRTTLEEANKVSSAIVGVAAFTSQNETQNAMFDNYLEYFGSKERVFLY